MTHLDESLLPWRAYRVLWQVGIRSLEELAGWNRAALLLLPDFGRVSLAAVEEELARVGLSLKESDS